MNDIGLDWRRQIDENQNFCLMPFTHLYRGTQGDVNLCCIAKDPPKNWYNNNMTDFSDVWKDGHYQKIRKMFINGIRSNHCQQCWDIDDNGGGSDREMYNDIIQYHMPGNFEISIENGNNLEVPFFLDLRPGNFCNFACRMCFVGVSSKINDYHKKFPELETVTGEKWQNIGNWIDDHENFEYIKKIMPHVTLLKLAGGEPLFMPGVIKLLRWCIENDHVNICLDITTNGSRIQGKILQWLKEFREVNIHMSIDGIGATQEYIREGSVWNDIDNAYQKYIDMGIKTHILVAVQMYNAYILRDIVQYWKSHGAMGGICFNFVEFPVEYKIDLLPDNDRMIIANDIRNEFGEFNDEQRIRYRVESLIQRLQTPQNISSKLKNNFIKRTELMDKIYGKDINMLHSRIGEILHDWKNES